MKEKNFKLIFNPYQANYLIRRGVPVLGAGKHDETSNFYIVFDGSSNIFNQAMTEWNERKRNI